MPATPEAKVKRAVKLLLERLWEEVDGLPEDLWYFPPMMMGMGRTGIPDLVGCMRGKFFAIECKAGNNQPTPLQERELDGIRRARGFAFVARESNLEELKERLTQWLET